MSYIANKRVLLGVSGGIAAYKSAILVRSLIKEGAEVTVVMTKAAERFITPLTFETLTQRPCYTDDMMFTSLGKINHVEIGKACDLIVVAPATANTIARISNGFADNLLSLTVLASTAKVLLVPSMHHSMWCSFAVQENLKRLDKDRFFIMKPDEGELASGDKGQGRFPKVSNILEEIHALLAPKDLRGKNFVVTGGPTREYIDPVRFISNSSSGKMGIEIARMALCRGANVRLILGPTSVSTPHCPLGSSLDIVRVESALDMLNALQKYVAECDVLVMAAAVSDERPRFQSSEKITKSRMPVSLELEPNPDILSHLKPLTHGKVVVGFAAETNDVEASGKKKLSEKGLSIIFANPVGKQKGFQSDFNEGILLDCTGFKLEVGPSLKQDIANLILDRVLEFLKQ